MYLGLELTVIGVAIDSKALVPTVFAQGIVLIFQGLILAGAKDFEDRKDQYYKPGGYC